MTPKDIFWEAGQVAVYHIRWCHLMALSEESALQSQWVGRAIVVGQSGSAGCDHDFQRRNTMRESTRWQHVMQTRATQSGEGIQVSQALPS